MPDLHLLVEDQGQEKFLSALLARIAAEQSVRLSIHARSAQGGMAKVLSHLEDFAKAVERGRESLPDGLVVGVEYAEDIVQAYRIQKVADRDLSFARLVSDFRNWLNRQPRRA